jgi:preprotein translocase subunit SecG
MGLIALVLIVLILLSASGWGYGRWYAGPVGGPPTGYSNPLGLVAAILVVLLIVWFLTAGFGLHLGAPWYY